MVTLDDVFTKCKNMRLFECSNEDQYAHHIEYHLNAAYNRRTFAAYRQGPDIRSTDGNVSIEIKLCHANPSSQFNIDQFNEYISKYKGSIGYIIVRCISKHSYTNKWIQLFKSKQIPYLCLNTFEYSEIIDLKAITRYYNNLNTMISGYNSKYSKNISISIDYGVTTPTLPVVEPSDETAVEVQLSNETVTTKEDAITHIGSIDDKFMSVNEQKNLHIGSQTYYSKNNTYDTIKRWISDHIDTMSQKGCKNILHLVRKLQKDIPQLPQSDRPGTLYLAISQMEDEGLLLRATPRSRIYAVKDKFL